ncbi:hypothetical protein KKC1_32000, partial [Calderihabitans maritimus]
MFQGFQYQYGSSFSHDIAVPVPIKRAAGRRRVSILGRHSSGCTGSGKNRGYQRSIGTPGDH